MCSHAVVHAASVSLLRPDSSTRLQQKPDASEYIICDKDDARFERVFTHGLIKPFLCPRGRVALSFGRVAQGDSLFTDVQHCDRGASLVIHELG